MNNKEHINKLIDDALNSVEDVSRPESRNRRRWWRKITLKVNANTKALQFFLRGFLNKNPRFCGGINQT